MDSLNILISTKMLKFKNQMNLLRIHIKTKLIDTHIIKSSSHLKIIFIHT